MVLTLPFPLLVLEIVLFFFFTSRFGFWPVLAAYWLPSLLALPVAAFFGRAAFLKLQLRLARGQEPGREALNLLLKGLGFLGLVLPFFTSRLAALVLLFPPTRWALLIVAQAWMIRKFSQAMSQGRFRVFTMGGAHGPFAGPFAGPFEGPREERDAQVVDITPIKIEHK